MLKAIRLARRMAGKRYEELSTDYVDRTSAPSPSVFSANTDTSKEAISSDFQETLQLQLLDAKAGDVITIPEGTHHLNRSLSLPLTALLYAALAWKNPFYLSKIKSQARKAFL